MGGRGVCNRLAKNVHDVLSVSFHYTEGHDRCAPDGNDVKRNLQVRGKGIRTAQNLVASFAPLGKGRVGRFMDRFDRWVVRINAPAGTAYLLHARKRVAAQLDSGVKDERPRLIAIPLGKTQEGVPVPRHVSQFQQEGAETT